MNVLLCSPHPVPTLSVFLGLQGRPRGRVSRKRAHSPVARQGGEIFLGGGGGGSFEPSEGGRGDRGVWTAKTVKRPRQQPAHPQSANSRAPLTPKRHTTPHSAQPRHTNYWAPRTRKRHRHQQEHRPQWLTERSDPTQHAKGRTGDRPGPRKETATRRNVTQGGGGCKRGSNVRVFV